MTIRIAIVGYGKIARDQHAPAILADPDFELAATVSRQGQGHAGLPCFASHGDLLANMAGIDAVAICTPPQVRFEIARDCICAGLHVLLEKPPGLSLGEVGVLESFAEERRVSLFTSWHAQHAAAVEAAADLLQGERIRTVRIDWRENVRKWHPGQAWVWEPGGFGVFDPGINALSIATRIVPGSLFVRSAELLVPANRQMPIAASIDLASPCADGALRAEFDWREQAGETWTIAIETADGRSILLSEGGARLAVDGRAEAIDGVGEYPSIYAAFAELIAARASHVDIAPLRLTAEAFLLGRRTEVEAFEE